MPELAQFVQELARIRDGQAARLNVGLSRASVSRFGSRRAAMFPALACLLACACSVRSGAAQYSSDHCNWRGSGLTHESHARDVEQVYLRCAEGSLQWLYPTGAIIVNLRPNTDPPAGIAAHLRACLKPRADSQGAAVYVERAGELRLLLSEADQAAGRVRCFSLREGALFVEATTRRDISKRVTAFQYELVSGGQEEDEYSTAASCKPCSDEELLMAVCTSDFVIRGSMQSFEEEEDDAADEEWAWLLVSVRRVFRQKRHVFLQDIGSHGRGWRTGRMKVPRKCGTRAEPEQGEFLFTGAVRFGEAWLSCAPRYKDFLHVYQSAVNTGSNPCHMDAD